MNIYVCVCSYLTRAQIFSHFGYQSVHVISFKDGWPSLQSEYIESKLCNLDAVLLQRITID
jgi:hypothetical protein